MIYLLGAAVLLALYLWVWAAVEIVFLVAEAVSGIR